MASQKTNIPANFEWYKSPLGYEWRDTEPRDVWGIPFNNLNEEERDDFESMNHIIPVGPFLVEKEPLRPLTLLKPLDNPLLFAQFSDLHPGAASFLEWSNTYGRLTEPNNNQENLAFIFTECTPHNDDELDFFKRNFDFVGLNQKYYIRTKADPLGFWLREHRELSFAVLLWELAINNDSRLSVVIEHKGKNEQYAYAYPISREKINSVDLEFVEKNRCYAVGDWGAPIKIKNHSSLYAKEEFLYSKAALRGVQNIISSKIAQYPIMLSLSSEITEAENTAIFQNSIKPTSLLSSMWYQFALALTGEIRLKRCLICNEWEYTSDKNKSWKMHAACAKRERSKRARIVAKEKRKPQKPAER